MKEPVRVPQILSAEEAKRLLLLAGKLQVRMLFSIGYGAGLRVSAANVLAGIGSPDGVRNASRRSGAALSFGLKWRMPSRTNAALSRAISRVASATNVSRSRLGRLAASSAGVRHSHHLAMPPLAAEPAEERTLEQLRVERVGLGAAMLARHGNARGMDDVRLHALREEPACQPEAVVAGLEGYRHATDLVTFLLGLRPPLQQ
jgi:hypothetical protein